MSDSSGQFFWMPQSDVANFAMKCLTCGASDEHSTRSCPISKTCYTCGMKGHINKVKIFVTCLTSSLMDFRPAQIVSRIQGSQQIWLIVATDAHRKLTR